MDICNHITGGAKANGDIKECKTDKKIEHKSHKQCELQVLMLHNLTFLYMKS